MNLIVVVKNLRFLLTPVFHHDGPEGWTRWNEVQNRYYFAVERHSDEKKASAFIKTIEAYYSREGIAIGGRLANDIRLLNPVPLAYVAYAIANLLDVKGVKRILRDLSNIDKADNEGARIYHNQLNEVNGIYFVHKVLGQQVLQVESGENKVFSPNRTGDKSCDIKASDGAKDIYYESKDSSKEIVSRRPEGEFLSWTPLAKGEIKSWIKDMLTKADEKGADVLLCKVPMWTKMGLPDDIHKYDSWAGEVFREAKKVGPAHFSIAVKDLGLKYVKRFYINKLDEAILFDLE